MHPNQGRALNERECHAHTHCPYGASCIRTSRHTHRARKAGFARRAAEKPGSQKPTENKKIRYHICKVDLCDCDSSHDHGHIGSGRVKLVDLDGAAREDFRTGASSREDYEACRSAIVEIAESYSEEAHPGPAVEPLPAVARADQDPAKPDKDTSLKKQSTHESGDEALASGCVFPGVSPVPSNSSVDAKESADEVDPPAGGSGVADPAAQRSSVLAGPALRISDVVVFMSAKSEQETRTLWKRIKRCIAKHTPLASIDVVQTVNKSGEYIMSELSYATTKDAEGFKWFWQKEFSTGESEQEIYFFRERFTHATVLPVYENLAHDVLSSSTFTSRDLLEEGNLRATARLAAQKLISEHRYHALGSQQPSVMENTINHVLNQLLLRGLRRAISECRAGTEPRSVLFRQGGRSKTTSPRAPHLKSRVSILPRSARRIGTTMDS